MMKWGIKMSPGSNSRPSFINHVFSTSWLKKLKLKSGRKVKSRPSLAENVDEGRFYGGVDDLYLRLSFGGDSLEKDKGIGAVRSLWIDSDDEHEVPLSRSRSDESQRYKDMMSEMREMDYDQEKDGLNARRKKASKGQEARALCRTWSCKTEAEGLQSAEVDAFESIPGQTIQSRRRSLSFPSYNLKTIEEDCIYESVDLQKANRFSEELSSLGSGDTNIREILLKQEPHRKSVFKSRGKQGKQRKVKTRNKAPSKNECKIKALEDIKKARRKKKKKKKERERAFDSYAIIKDSFDPQQDFRDSMLEMIIEKGIKQPEELEDLLVCYLTLNRGEYHDLIIKVFRQVWFDLNQVHFGLELQKECCGHHQTYV